MEIKNCLTTVSTCQSVVVSELNAGLAATRISSGFAG